jgi:hypothetical protein
MRAVALWLCVFLIGEIFLLGQASAAPTAEQRAEIAAIGTLLRKAGSFYNESKFKESAELVKEVQGRLEKLAEGADQPTLAQLKEPHGRLAKAHALLEVEGITLPELKALPAAAAVKSARKAAAMPTISFVTDVAPVLNARCGNCHVRAARGMFSMATYETLMKGPAMSGKVIFPGDAKGSVLIEKIEDKQMPPNGAGIPDAELATLKKWVEEGAKFDGANPTAQLTALLPAGTQPAATPAATVEQATGKETVSFAKDIAPILSPLCTGCHGTNNNPRGGFSLNTMAGLIKGGDRGEPILPGKPADSLLIKKLKGTADGARMPMGLAPLDAAKIAKIEKWIEEGAKFDGPSPDQPIAEVAALAKAEASTHDELSADRAKLAQENWQLGMPGTTPNKYESANFLVLGNVGENTLAEIAKKAEALAPEVGKTFKTPPNQPLVKGRMTLFVLGDRYDYGEFGKMVEKRELASASRGHYRYSILDAYGVVLTPKGSDYSLDTLIAQQIGAVYVASLGKRVPHWFAEGCGRVVAARMATGADARVSKWDDELSAALSSLTAPDDFLKNKLTPEDADVCAASFARFLMSDPRRFGVLIDNLRKGGQFPKAFSDSYGAPPNEVAKAWAQKPPKPGPLKRGK